MDIPPAVSPEAHTTDPEIQPLLRFDPVRRATRRSDGWPPERQRDFIVGLARLGNVDLAAQMTGRTASGAYKVRTSAGAEGFADAWDGALALWHHRNPKPFRVGRPSRGELLANPQQAADPEPPRDPAAEELQDREVFDGMLDRYVLKLADERTARLAGRIAEADFYVRQLSFIELVLDLGGRARDVLEALGRPDLPLVRVAATPMSVLLDRLRRSYWAEGGEPDRPPLGDLGEHDDEVGTGPPFDYNSAREGVDYQTWCRRRAEAAALAAEAQAAWEKKARADAKRWRKRQATEDTAEKEARP